MTRTPDGRGRERRTDTILPSVSSAREHGCPPPRPDTMPPRQGGRPSPCTYAASAADRPTGLARVRVARRGLLRSARALAAAALLALSGALALPTTAQAQEISLVSNLGESIDTWQNVNPPDFALGSVEIGEQRVAQRFTTGPNEAGYTLQSVVLNLRTNLGTGSVVQVAIHDNGSSGNPGTLLVVLDNPADPIGDNTGTAGNRTFSAPNPLSLDADTHYWVVVSNMTTITNANFDISLTDSNNETTAHGFSIRDTRHQWTPGSWQELAPPKPRMEVRGTVVIPPGLEVTLHLSDDAVLEDATPITVTATVSPASPVAFTVEISASPVAPATDDEFELSTNRTLSFAANETGSTGTVTVRPVDDDEPEPPDVVTISGIVSNPAIPNPDAVRLTIHNNDVESFEVVIDAPAAVNEGAGTATVTYTLTKRDGAPVALTDVIFYHRDAETATRGVDYTPPVGDLSGGGLVVLETGLPPSVFSNTAGTVWVAEGSFTIGIVDDQEGEPDETIVFTVEAGKGESPEQTIVIRDDDRPPAVSIAAANPTVLEEQPAVFTLSRTTATGSPLTVTVALMEQADRDLLPDGAATERTVTFARGSSTAALTVELKNDRLAEPDGDLTAAVQAGAGYTVGDPSSATVTVEDVDGVPEIDRIEVVSTPRLWSRGAREPDTYGEGENIRIEVRFDQLVHVEGYPTMEVEVGDPCGSVCEADYESGSGTDKLVFAYLVLEVDIDRNGIAIPANPIEVVYGESIRSATDYEADLSYKRKGTQRGHKVDGSRAAGPYLSVEDAEAHEADGAMEFTVRLEPHGLGIVRVDYATVDGTATAGEDFTETRGTLRFNPLETERTVSVPITDDAHEDDGETFTLRLSNPQGARLRSGEREATGTIRNSDPEPELTAEFPASAFASASHSGADDRPQVVVAFSEPVAEFGADTRSVTVTGGTVASVQPHAEDGLENAWVFFLVPDGGGDVTFALVADAACASGGICTAGGKVLAHVPAASTIPGPGEPEEAPLTASFEDLPERHDGSGFRFRVAFSEPLSWMNGRRLREDVVAVAGGRATAASRVNRRRDLWELTVEPDSPAAVCTKDGRALSNTISATVAGPADAGPAVSVSDASATEGDAIEFTVSLSAARGRPVTVRYATSDGTAESGTDFTAASGTLTFAAGETSKTVSVATTDDSADEEDETFTLTLSNPADATLGDAAATGTIVDNDNALTPLTAEFRDMPETHDGESAFTLRIAFSEPLSWMNGRRLREDVVAVAGGRATKASRVNRRRDLWQLTVEPNSLVDVTVTLAAGAACGTPAAICTKDGRALSETISATVRGPAGNSAASAPMKEDLAARACSALAGGDGLAPGAAAAALWRDGDMDNDQLAALDSMGNGNGTYDLGDLLAWMNRCRPGSGSAAGAGPPPSAPPALPASQPARGGSQRRKGARGPARRRRAAPDPPAAGSRTRRFGWLRTALLAVVIAAWGCGDGIVAPHHDAARDGRANASALDPGPLHVRLTAPPQARDIGAMLVVEGPAIDSLQAPGLEMFETDESSSTRREVVIAGALPPDAPVLRVWVPHRGDHARYRLRLLQVAAEDFTLGDLSVYGSVISR